jgi:hypothetical protein
MKNMILKLNNIKIKPSILISFAGFFTAFILSVIFLFLGFTVYLKSIFDVYIISVSFGLALTYIWIILSEALILIN